MVSFIAIKWPKPDQKLNGHFISAPVCKWLQQEGGLNGPVLGWPVPTERDNLKTRLVLFLDVMTNTRCLLSLHVVNLE
jgi:hypothetical protein